jgi:hypothetical protein
MSHLPNTVLPTPVSVDPRISNSLPTEDREAQIMWRLRNRISIASCTICTSCANGQFCALPVLCFAQCHVGVLVRHYPLFRTVQFPRHPLLAHDPRPQRTNRALQVSGVGILQQLGLLSAGKPNDGCLWHYCWCAVASFHVTVTTHRGIRIHPVRAGGARGAFGLSTKFQGCAK